MNCSSDFLAHTAQGSELVETTATGGDTAERSACPLTRVALCPGGDNVTEMRAAPPLLFCLTVRETLPNSLVFISFVVVLFCFLFFSVPF